jgi:outer membrane receptor protein involved in Fe transport
MKKIRSSISLILILVFIFVSNYAYNQSPQGKGGGQKGGNEGIVSGQITDKVSNEPLEYANVIVFKVNDSLMVSGTVTGTKGKFTIGNLPYGNYYLVADYIGYHKMTTSSFKLTPKSNQYKAGVILLQPSSTNLDQVVVMADKPHVEYKIDKKVVNVSQDIMATSGSAVAVLENVPSLDVDIEGNVSMRGTSNFQVLIDGKPSILASNDALQQIPASTIDRIEIITNPSAKYDPDGVGGILNVILKQQKKSGVNGVINTSISSGNKYRADALLNYRTKKYNIYGGVDYNYMEMTMKGTFLNETYLEDTTSYRDSETDGGRNRDGWGAKAGIDYYLSDKTTLGFSSQLGSSGFGRDNNTFRYIYSNPVSSEEYSRSINESTRNRDFYRLNLDFKHDFNDTGHKLEASAFYSMRNSDDWEEQNDYMTDSNGNINDDEPDAIKTIEDDQSDEYRINIDYTLPFSENGKIETGYQSRFEYSNGKYFFSDFDYDLNDWVSNDLYSNEVDFKRNIHAAYATYSNEWNTIGYQLGLRGELTDRSIKNAEDTESFIINRFDFFPSIHLSKQITEDHQLFASYSKRIDRPGGRELDPFPNYMDPYNQRVGNPELEPEYIDSYELGYQMLINKSFISAEAYYRINKNKITRIRTLQEDGSMLHTYQNLNRDYSLGVELMGNLSFNKWLNVNASINVYDYRLEGSIEEEDIENSSTNWSGKLNATMKFKHDFRLQLSGIYRGPTATVQGTREGYFVTNIALRKDFFDNRFSATLSVRDILSSAKYESTSYGDGFYSYSKFEREAPIVSLNLSYIINNYKKQRNGERGEGMDSDMDMEF